MARKYIRWSAEKVASYAMQDGYIINPLYAFVSVHELIPMTCPYAHNIEMRWKNFIILLGASKKPRIYCLGGAS